MLAFQGILYSEIFPAVGTDTLRLPVLRVEHMTAVKASCSSALDTIGIVVDCALPAVSFLVFVDGAQSFHSGCDLLLELVSWFHNQSNNDSCCTWVVCSLLGWGLWRLAMRL